MQTISTQLLHARTALAPVAGANAALEARLLAQHAWGLSAEALVQHADTSREKETLENLLNRRLNHEPVAQILGYKYFWKDSFAVSADVLTPRADSETMIETLLRLRPEYAAALRVLDLGTGSGCLLLSTLREYANATGVAVDQSEPALAIAKKNALSLNMMSRSDFFCSHWCSNVQGTFDVVLANPPYIPTADIATLDADVRVHEPYAALHGGADGLDEYRSILAQIKPHMRPQGLLLFEVGAGQAADVAKLAEMHGFAVIETTPDLAGIPRVVALTTEF